MSKTRFLGYGRQLIDDDDVAAVTSVLRGDYLTQGDSVARFERALAERVGANHAVAVSSGTAALHIACLAAELEPGQRGLTSALTFIASANAFIYCGASADLVDIDSESLSMDLQSLANAIHDDETCRVVIPVLFGGLAVGSAQLRETGSGRTIIEDASHALGGVYEDGKVIGGCAHADMATFSFHPVKSITTAEGGAVTTNDGDIYDRLLRLRNHGIERDSGRFEYPDQSAPWVYEQQDLGFNYRMNDLQAALGLSQLGKLDRFIQRRREISMHYDDAFRNIASLETPQSKPDARLRSANHLYTVRVDFESFGTSREQVMQQLRDAGIGTQVHYVPVYRHPYHQKRGIGGKADFPETEAHYQRCLSLPLHAGLSDEEADHVVATVSSLLG